MRSVAEVFNLIVNENRMLNNLPSGAPTQGAAAWAVANPSDRALQEALKTTYATLRDTISKLSDADLNAAVRMFGRDTTKQGAALMLLFDQHEHLGQSIAYAEATASFRPGASRGTSTLRCGGLLETAASPRPA